MRRNNFFPLLILLFLFTGTAFSQKVYRKGYVIKKSGDALTGLVAFNPDISNPRSCTFKRFEIATEVNYTPDMISAFGYEKGKRYESLTVDGKTVFLEVLVKGELTLYSTGAKYFLKGETNDLTEIKEGKNDWTANGQTKSFSNLEELLGYLADGKTLKIKDKFSIKTDLVPAIASINSQNGKPYNVYNRTFTEKELNEQAWRSGASRNSITYLAGLNIYSLTINPNTNSFLPQPETETGFVGGVSLGRILSKKSDRFSIRTDLLIVRQTFYSYSEKDLILGSISRDDAFYSFTALKVPVLLQNSFNNNRIKPYINYGIAGMVFVDKKYRHISEVENTNNEIRISEDSKLVYSIAEISGIAGAGLKIRIRNTTQLHIEGRFEYGTGIFNTNYPDIKGFKQHSLAPSLLVGISF